MSIGRTFVKYKDVINASMYPSLITLKSKSQQLICVVWRFGVMRCGSLIVHDKINSYSEK